MAFACSSTLSNAFVGLNVALVVRAHIGKEFVNSYIRFNKPFSGLRNNFSHKIIPNNGGNFWAVLNNATFI